MPPVVDRQNAERVAEDDAWGKALSVTPVVKDRPWVPQALLEPAGDGWR